MDEYRFQLGLNQQRTQATFTVSVAITAAATALVRTGDGRDTLFLVGFIFIVGALAAAVGALAVGVGHEYYRATRDHKSHLEEALDLGPFAIKTTRGMGGRPRRLTITRATLLTLWLIAGIDLGGATYAFYEAFTY
jgi:hypothetical protein